MTGPGTATCPGCRLRTPVCGHGVPPGFRASGGCWHRYGELLARSYGDPDRRDVHQLVVDAYVAQHAGSGEPRHVRRVALCLMTLQLVLEAGHDPAHGPALHARMVATMPPVPALEPPVPCGTTTVDDVLAAGDARAHGALARTWARDVWGAWHRHHDTVRAWNARSLA